MKREHYQEYTDGDGQHLHATGVRPGKRLRSRQWLLIGGIAALLLVAGAATYFFLLAGDEAGTPPAAQQTKAKPLPTETTLSPEEAAQPVTFKSATLNIEITHRKDWTLRESGDKSQLIVTSPSVTYIRKDGSSAEGEFTVKIRNGATEPMKATIEKAVATQASEVIAYTAPTENQRHYTNLSYGGTAEAFQFFLVTGSTEFKAGNPFALTLPLNDMYIIAGGFGVDANDALAFDAVPKTALANPVVAQGIDIVESVKVF